MGIFKKASNVLGDVIGTIDKAVTDKDKKNELIHAATMAHIENTIHARNNQNGVARWVRAILAIIVVVLFGAVNYMFLNFINNMGVSDEMKVTFYYKLVSDVVMILMVVMGFYFGSSEYRSDNISDIKKSIGKIK